MEDDDRDGLRGKEMERAKLGAMPARDLVVVCVFGSGVCVDEGLVYKEVAKDRTEELADGSYAHGEQLAWSSIDQPVAARVGVCVVWHV